MNAIVDFKEISELNLESIKQKLMHVQSGEGWTLEQVNAVEVEYRRFLYLMKKYPNEQTSPAVAVDIFWHYHILDTMKYALDCEQVFGHFLHHYPSAPVGGSEAEIEHHRSGDRMRALYEQTFAVRYDPAAAFDVSSGPAVQDAAAAAQTAFCGIVRPPAQARNRTSTAFCGIVRPPAQTPSLAGAAFCGIVRPPEQAQSLASTAFCGIVPPPEQAQSLAGTAFCGIVPPALQAQPMAGTAFCGIVRPPAQAQSMAGTAFCGVVRPPAQAQPMAGTAFCGVVRPPKQPQSMAGAAFCGIVPPRSRSAKPSDAIFVSTALPAVPGAALVRASAGRTKAGIHAAAAN